MQDTLQQLTTMTELVCPPTLIGHAWVYVYSLGIMQWWAVPLHL